MACHVSTCPKNQDKSLNILGRKKELLIRWIRRHFSSFLKGLQWPTIVSLSEPLARSLSIQVFSFQCFIVHLQLRKRGRGQNFKLFCICNLTAPWPTLGHYQGGSLTQPMLSIYQVSNERSLGAFMLKEGTSSNEQ